MLVRKYITITLLVIALVVVVMSNNNAISAASGYTIYPRIYIFKDVDKSFIKIGENECTKIYMHGEWNTLSFRQYVSQSIGDAPTYFKPGLDEYGNLTRQVESILSSNFSQYYRGFSWIDRRDEQGNFIGFMGFKVFMDSQADNTTISSLYDALKPLMQSHNLTKLVVILVDPLSNASKSDLNAATIQLYQLMQEAYSNPANYTPPKYLQEALNLTFTGKRYEGFHFITSPVGGFVELVFREPLPEPTNEDIQQVAQWLLEHTPACGIPIVIYTQLTPPAEIPKAEDPIWNPPQQPMSNGTDYRSQQTESSAMTGSNGDDVFLAVAVYVSAVLVGVGFILLTPRLHRPW